MRLLALLVAALMLQGCNLFGRLDNPSADPDKYDAAVQLANSGDCGDATNLLNSIVLQTDDVNSALGWSEMCQGGVTANMLATTLYQYSTSSSNFYSLGQLARAMLPISATGLSTLQLASSQFGGIRDVSRRNVRIALADFAIAAWILAKQSGNNGGQGLVPGDISSNSNCAADAANCSTSTNCISGMSTGDLSSFESAISAANTALQTSGATSLAALSNSVVQGLTATPTGGATTTSVGLCFIFNYVIPNQ